MSMRWNKIATPSFVLAVVILLAALTGMTTVMRQFGLSLIKKPVPLRRDLDTLTSRFGHYLLEEKQGRLPAEQESVLGTTQYITWIFRDERLKEGEPGALIRLHIPYYTGTIDSVPHVPDRCFVAGGAKSLGVQTLYTKLQSDRIHVVDGKAEAVTTLGKLVKLPGLEVPLTVATFVQTDNQSKSYCVAYFFVANDDYVASPEGVRLKAFNLTDQYAYYCKIEVMPFGVGDPEACRKVVGEFLSSALPEIMLFLPDWAQVEAGHVKPQSTVAEN